MRNNQEIKILVGKESNIKRMPLITLVGIQLGSINNELLCGITLK